MRRILWIVLGMQFAVYSFALTIPKGTLYYDNSKTGYDQSLPKSHFLHIISPLNQVSVIVLADRL